MLIAKEINRNQQRIESNERPSKQNFACQK